MTVLKLKIADDNLDGLVNYLIRKRIFDYENHSTDVSILIADNLRLVDMTDHLNLLILKRDASFILIDIISGGGKDRGLMYIAGGAEKSYNREVARLLYEYAELNGLVIEPL